MRYSVRLVVAILALALIGSSPGSGTPASAEAHKAAQVTARVVEPGNKLFMTGRVKGGNVRFITIQKATRCDRQQGCNWFRYRTVRGQGPQDRYRVRIGAPRRGNWYWRAAIRGDVSRTWRTFQRG